MKKTVCNIASILISIYITVNTGNWAIRAAARSRGYEAIGGEYIFIPLVFLFTWIVLRALLSVLVDFAEKKALRGRKHRKLIKKYQTRTSARLVRH